jgi:uncharacterized protein (TIGR03437 family)
LAPDGSVYIGGSTASADFPVTAEAFQRQRPGRAAAFVSAFSADGSELLLSSFYGGSGREHGLALALDGAAGVWIGGSTDSADLPLGDQPLQSELAGRDDAFLARLDPSGSRLMAATYLGGADCRSPFVGSRCEQINAIFPDEWGVLAGGQTISRDFPLAAGAAQPDWRGGVAFGDGFIVRLDRAASTLAAATLFGGASEDQINGLVSDRSGDVYAVGATGSANLVTTPDAFQPLLAGRDDAFLARFGPDLGRIRHATFLGGGSSDRGFGIAADRNRQVIIVGETGSADFPTTAGSVQPQFAGIRSEGGDAYIAKLDFSPAPYFSAASVVNAGSLESGPLAPGEIITIFGNALGGDDPSGAELRPDGRLSAELGGARVWINGVDAALIFVVGSQINAIVPYAVDSASARTLWVEHDGVPSPQVTMQAAAVAPALFTLDGSGRGPGVILNQDYTLNSAANAAARGSIVILYATGEGQTDPPGQDGLPASEPLPRPLARVEVRIAGIPAETLYAGAAPGLTAGVLQINARVPLDAAAGAAAPVSFSVAGQNSQPGVTLAVE